MQTALHESLATVTYKTWIHGWYNTKWRTDYQDLSFDPETKESCKWKYKDTCVVYIDWVVTRLDDIWNFLIWYNYYNKWFTLNDIDGTFYNDIYSAWVTVEKYKNWLIIEGFKKNISDSIRSVFWTSFNYDKVGFAKLEANENEDRVNYTAWFSYAQQEEEGWSLPSLANAFKY
jgi:hypothetical protein